MNWSPRNPSPSVVCVHSTAPTLRRPSTQHHINWLCMYAYDARPRTYAQEFERMLHGTTRMRQGRHNACRQAAGGRVHAGRPQGAGSSRAAGGCAGCVFLPWSDAAASTARLHEVRTCRTSNATPCNTQRCRSLLSPDFSTSILRYPIEFRIIKNTLVLRI